jgi:hypothetical protein
MAANKCLEHKVCYSNAGLSYYHSYWLWTSHFLHKNSSQTQVIPPRLGFEIFFVVAVAPRYMKKKRMNPPRLDFEV